jgi:hypothetical protein
MEERRKRWKVGDKVTYKSHKECGGEYKYGGEEHDGFVGDIWGYSCWKEDSDCFQIEVRCRGGDTYTMLESEFKEWGSDNGNLSFLSKKKKVNIIPEFRKIDLI